MSTNATETLANFDAMYARKSPAEARQFLATNLAVWEERAAKVEAWERAGGKGPCPLPEGWTAFDVATIRNGLAARKQGRAA